MLLAPFDVEVDVFEYKDDAKILLLLKVFLNLINHLNVVALLPAFEIKRLKKLGEHFLLRVVKNRVNAYDAQLLHLILLLSNYLLLFVSV